MGSSLLAKVTVYWFLVYKYYMGESFQVYSYIQDFEDNFPQKVILKMLN